MDSLKVTWRFYVALGAVVLIVLGYVLNEDWPGEVSRAAGPLAGFTMCYVVIRRRMRRNGDL